MLEGWLYKRGEHIKNWRPRYMAVTVGKPQDNITKFIVARPISSTLFLLLFMPVNNVNVYLKVNIFLKVFQVNFHVLIKVLRQPDTKFCIVVNRFEVIPIIRNYYSLNVTMCNIIVGFTVLHEYYFRYFMLFRDGALVGFKTKPENAPPYPEPLNDFVIKDAQVRQNRRNPTTMIMLYECAIFKIMLAALQFLALLFQSLVPCLDIALVYSKLLHHQKQ